MKIIKYLGVSAILVALSGGAAFAQTPIDTTPGDSPAEDAVEQAAQEDDDSEAPVDEYAETEEELEESVDAGEAKADHNWRLSASVGLNVGQGTFVNLAQDSPNADEASANIPGDPDSFADRVSLGYSLRPSYSYKDHSFSTGISMSQYLTRGGGIDEPNEIRFSDIPLSYGWSGYNIEAIDTRVSAGGGIGLPTSERSQASNLYLNTNASGTLSRQFLDSIGLSLSLSGSKAFHKFKGTTAPIELNGVENVVYREGDIVGDGIAAIGGVFTEYSLTPSFGASWSIWDFRLSAGYSISTFWTYDGVIPEDEFTSGFTDEDGDPVVQGEGRQVGQFTSGSLGLSYSPSDIELLEGWSASLSLRNSTTPKTADNRSFNFPFWTFDAASNRSAISFGLSYSYGGPL